MALINCPECGREGVSDQAVACPQCGFGIKEYTENKNIELKKAEELRKKEEWKQSDEYKETKRRQEEQLTEWKIHNKIVLEEPEFNRTILLYSFLAFLVILAISFGNKNIVKEEQISLFTNFSLIFIGVPFGLYSFYFFKKKEDYKEYLQNTEEYQQKRLAEISKPNPVAQSIGRALGDSIPGLECPICHRFEVKKITTINRAVSVGTVGLASDKIGKQYECKYCGHKW